MDVMLKTHGAKDVYKAPEGLAELCADISREVLREQPRNLYSFIADYVDALLITRENTKVAIKVVEHVLRGSENIISILSERGFSMESIAAVAPKLQSAFRDYLDSANKPCNEICEESEEDRKSEISIQNLLQEYGISLEEANRAAIIVQKAFRGHYQKMLYRESRGEIQWQRVLVSTIKILKKAGVSQEEINEMTPTIMSAYKGYYTRKNEIMRLNQDYRIGSNLKDPVSAVAWLKMVSEDTDFSKEQSIEKLESHVTE